MSWLFNAAIDWLTHLILDGLNALWSLLLQTALNIPNVTTLPQVQDITKTSLVVVNICFVLMILAVGVVVMGKETVQTRYGLAELGPRLVIGFIAANVSTLLCDKLITFANALTFALAGETVASDGSFSHLRDTVHASLTSGPVAVVALVFAVILSVLTALMMVQWLVRLGVLVVLVGIAPCALACHATPWTEPAAKLWWRAMLGTIGTVILQALALHAALSVFLNPAANVQSLGIPNDPTHTFNLFIVTCLLWAVLKIPGLMRRYVTKGGGGGGGIGRFVIAQQLTRALTRVVTKVPVRAPAGAAGRAAGGAGGATGSRISGPRPTPISSGGESRIPPRPGGRGPTPSPVGRGSTSRSGRVDTASPGPRPTGRGAPRARTATANPAPAPRPTPASGRRTNPPIATGRSAPPPAARRSPPQPRRTPPANRSNPRRNP
jgi:hypothetical protein